MTTTLMTKTTLLTREVYGEEIIVVDSRSLAEKFGKQHKNVIRSIETTINYLKTSNRLKHETDGFISKTDGIYLESTYTDNKGEPRKEYLLDEKAFTIIVMGFSGLKAMDVKLEFVREFNLMKEHLQALANGHPNAFISSLPMTRHSIEKYLPKYLNWKNADEIIPILCERIKKEIRRANKIEILASAIFTIKKIRDSYDKNFIAYAQINKELAILETLHNNTLRAKLGGNATTIGKLKEECDRLKEQKYSDEDFHNFINQRLEDEEYRVYSSSIRLYINYVAEHTGRGQKEIWKDVYKAGTREFGLRLGEFTVPTGGSRIKLIWLKRIDISDYLLNYAYSWARNCGFQV